MHGQKESNTRRGGWRSTKGGLEVGAGNSADSPGSLAVSEVCENCLITYASTPNQAVCVRPRGGRCVPHGTQRSLLLCWAQMDEGPVASFQFCSALAYSKLLGGSWGPHNCGGQRCLLTVALLPSSLVCALLSGRPLMCWSAVPTCPHCHPLCFYAAGKWEASGTDEKLSFILILCLNTFHFSANWGCILVLWLMPGGWNQGIKN